MPRRSTVWVWPSEAVERFLAERTGAGKPGHAAREGLEWYAALLERARFGLWMRFSAPELGWLQATARHLALEPRALSGAVLAAQLLEAEATLGWGRTYRVDPEAVAGQLRGLELAEVFALVDALRRHWLDPGPDREADTWRQLGLEPR